MDVFRYDRDNGINNGIEKVRGGGIACYVRKGMKLNIILCIDLSRVDQNFEILTLRCRRDFGKLFHIMIVYRPPSASHDGFLRMLSDFNDQGHLYDNDLYIRGDFNIDFLHRNDVKTKSLVSFLTTFGLKQHISSYTHVTGFLKSCIDFIISKRPENLIVKSCVLMDVLSDHFPVFLCVTKLRSVAKFSKKKKRTTRRLGYS